MAFQRGVEIKPLSDPACSALMGALDVYFGTTMLTDGHPIRLAAGALMGQMLAYSVSLPAAPVVAMATTPARDDDSSSSDDSSSDSDDAPEPCGVLAWGISGGRVPRPIGRAPDPLPTSTSK